MSLTTTLQEIKKVLPLANENLEGLPTASLNVLRGRKRNAQEQLKNLREQYFQDLLRSSVFILAVGSERDSFTKEATDSYSSFGAFSADPEGFYRDLAGRIPAGAYTGKQTVSNLFDILGRHLEDKALELGVIGYPQLQFKQEYRATITSQEDFVQLVKRAINEQVGGELAGLNAVRSLTDKAIELGHAKPSTPIVMSVSDEKLALDLNDALNRITTKVFMVVTGEASDKLNSVEGALTVKEVSAKSVGSTLKSIRSQLKK